MKIKARKRQPWSDLPFYLLILAVLLALPSRVLAETKYSFVYFLGDGSGDWYKGYVFAPDNAITSGYILYNQPWSMGGAALGGSYYIWGETGGYSSEYDKEEYITSFYDANTGYYSNTFATSTGQKTSGTSLYVADRSSAAEWGYVYDPSVPSTDAYFGNSDVCYSFGTSYSSADFLVVYISDLPYWNQPSSYPNSCAEVAGATLLSYWVDQGYSNLLTSNWESSWPDNTANTTSYVSLIGQLAADMGYSSAYGTYLNYVGPGLVAYAASKGYTFYQTTYDVSYSRSGSWAAYTATLNSGRPVLDYIWWSAGGHIAVDRGYWNDGHVLEDFGWGTTYTNVKLDWSSTTYGSSYSSAEILYYTDFY